MSGGLETSSPLAIGNQLLVGPWLQCISSIGARPTLQCRSPYVIVITSMGLLSRCGDNRVTNTENNDYRRVIRRAHTVPTRLRTDATHLRLLAGDELHAVVTSFFGSQSERIG